MGTETTKPTNEECLRWLHDLHGLDSILDDVDDNTSGDWGSSSVISRLKEILTEKRNG